MIVIIGIGLMIITSIIAGAFIYHYHQKKGDR